MTIRTKRQFNENKLIRILNLLDSPMEGEVLAAAKCASRYLKTHGASWNEVIQKSRTPSCEPRLSSGFIGLKDAVILKRTQRARLLAVKLTNGRTENFWFPCSTLKEVGRKIYAAKWIVERKEKEMAQGENYAHIHADLSGPMG
ncbi:MAG: hypothetical protein NPINA01_16320 [Nitrospinaceae bacterium]|nr:MAG: hypothetical protein NPINA01_16320 [Nitrospinaceae bacterium]